MARGKVIIIAMQQALNNDDRIRRRMQSAEKRARRQSARFAGLNIGDMQEKVNRNLLRVFLSINGRHMDLLDLLNFIKSGCRVVDLSKENVSTYYSLAHTVTLNGIYLYQYLSQAGYDPVIVQNYALADLEPLLEENPLAVCISSNFILLDEIKAMAETVKAKNPAVPVIAGGMLVKKVLDPGPALAPQSLAYFSSFHGKVDAFIIEAQGEQTLLAVLSGLTAGGDLHGVPNLGLFDDAGRLVFTERRKEALDIDRTAIQWDTIPRHYLRNTLPVNSSRGCAYRCRFCTYHWFFPQVHYKSIAVLRRELQTIGRLGFVRHIRFTDDNFTANETRLTRVLEMMMEEGFDFTWSSFARASALTPDLVRLMRASGCEFVDMGIESGSQDVLENMDKRLERDQSLRAIRLLSEHGIYSRGSFIVGFPGETEESFEETVDLINESGLPYYHPYLFYYSRSAPIHRERERFALEGIGLTWRHASMDAVQASELMSHMVERIERGYTDGVSYVEEIYKLLRGEGYAPDAIFELFRLKRELQLTNGGGGCEGPMPPHLEKTLQALRALVR